MQPKANGGREAHSEEAKKYIDDMLRVSREHGFVPHVSDEDYGRAVNRAAAVARRVVKVTHQR